MQLFTNTAWRRASIPWSVHSARPSLSSALEYAAPTPRQPLPAVDKLSVVSTSPEDLASNMDSNMMDVDYDISLDVEPGMEPEHVQQVEQPTVQVCAERQPLSAPPLIRRIRPSKPDRAILPTSQFRLPTSRTSRKLYPSQRRSTYKA